MNEREAIVATADRIAQRMGGRFVLNEDRPMNDKPEAVAWLYEIPGANHRYAYAQRRDCFGDGWTETPLYAHPPSQPDASALVEALVKHRPIVIEQVDSGMWSLVLRFSNAHVMRDTADALRAALTAWEAQHG